MTRSTAVLDAIEPVPVIYLNRQALDNLGIEPGGEIRAFVRPDGALKQGNPFIRLQNLFR